MNRQTDNAISAELDGLRDEYTLNGLESLRSVVELRSNASEDTDRIYLLAAPDLTPLAGTLPSWPRDGARTDGWINFIANEGEGESDGHERVASRALRVELPGGYHLLAGRTLHDREDLYEHLLRNLFWALAVTLVLALAGGLVMSRSVLRRIETINRTSRSIMAGHLDQRMPITGSGDEYDQLSEQLNAMLDQISRLMDGMRQVTDNVAHDLRSPLSRLRSRLDVTLLSARSEQEYRAVIEQTITDVDELLMTFNALLNIAQTEAGTRRDDWEEVNMSILAQDAAELYQPLAEDQGLKFITRIEGNLKLPGNRHLLTQALGNLLDNAIKYTPKGGTVELGAAHVNTAIEVTVCDNGPGIAAPDRDRVLERFVRLEASRSTPGNGLGLSMVRAVAKLHNAQLELQDNQPGLRVVLRFPVK